MAESERYVLECDDCGEDMTSMAEAWNHNHDSMVPARFRVIDVLWDR